MKTCRFNWIAMMALGVVLLVLPANYLRAQEMSAEEAERLMNAINEKMRELEQMLAKASLEPEQLSTIIEQLRHAVDNNETDQLPRSLREFLLNNPDLLAKLKNPDAQGDDLLKVEDEIRRLLATEDQGLERLLQQNPEMLQRLLQEQDQIEDALRNHAQLENDLQNLFKRTTDEMESTEGDIEKLIELAQKMQQQMNGQGQDPGNKLDQPKPGEGEKPGEQDQNKQNNEGQEGQNAQENYEANGSQGNPTGAGGNQDPAAWDTILPRTRKEQGTDPNAQPKPKGWAAEAAKYFELLAKQARIERERARAAGNGNGNGGSGDSGNGD